MKLLTISLVIIFSVVFSSASYAEWKKFSYDASGLTYYVDFEIIRKNDEYVYWWSLFDYLKPNKSGILSGKLYTQGDCELFRFKTLSASLHKEPMGKGTGRSHIPENPEWDYAPPDSNAEVTLKAVCEYAK